MMTSSPHHAATAAGWLRLISASSSYSSDHVPPEYWISRMVSVNISAVGAALACLAFHWITPTGRVGSSQALWSEDETSDTSLRIRATAAGS